MQSYTIIITLLSTLYILSFIISPVLALQLPHNQPSSSSLLHTTPHFRLQSPHKQQQQQQNSFQHLNQKQQQIRRPAHLPTSAPTVNKVCDVVLVIDNYIVREYDSSNLDDLRHKYMSYFADVDYFYQQNFHTKMNLLHMHLEEGASFSDTTDDGELLDSFRSALLGGVFGTEIPPSACTYHLVTGRDTPGIGGLAWIGSACNSNMFNAGFSVDERSQDSPIDVIRRMTHEIGHGFGGQHFDYYSSNPLYTCDAGVPRSDDRILRSIQATDYTYITNSLFISDCASATMNNSMPSLSCLWGSTTRVVNVPMVTLYRGRNFKGTTAVLYARNGSTASQCYNIVYPYGSIMSSFRLNGAVSGIRFFESQDCIGQVFEFANTSVLPYVGDSANKKANSFQFIN